MNKSVFNYLDIRNCTAKGHPPPKKKPHTLCDPSFVWWKRPRWYLFILRVYCMSLWVQSKLAELPWKVAMILMCEMRRLLPLCKVVSPFLAFQFVRGLLVCVFACPCPFGPVQFVVDFVLADWWGTRIVSVISVPEREQNSAHFTHPQALLAVSGQLLVVIAVVLFAWISRQPTSTASTEIFSQLVGSTLF